LVAAAGLALWAGSAAPAAAQAACRNVALRSPVTGEAVTGNVPILGSAQIDGFNFYKVEWAPAGEPEAWRAVSETKGEPVLNGLLDQWDTSRVPDGAYRLKLTVVDQVAAEVCRALVEDIVVGAVNTLGTGTATATETATSTPTAAGEAAEATALPTAEATTEPAAEATAADAGSTEGGEPTVEGEGEAAASSATPVTITAEPASPSAAAELGMGGLVRAFGGGFCLALLAAAALVAFQALRGEE
jgi:hypothetical protein